MIRGMLREVMLLIDTNRQRGQTTRLIEQCLRDGVLLVVANQQAKKHVEAQSTRSEFDKYRPDRLRVAKVSQMIPSMVRGLQAHGGVVFDNHAVHMIASKADQEIATLEERILFLQRKNAEILHQLEFERETRDKTTIVLEALSRDIQEKIGPNSSYKSDLPWGRDYEAVQTLQAEVRRLVHLFGVLSEQDEE